jgi:transcriptional regulator with GAF, ATPase, and Fis domain
LAQKLRQAERELEAEVRFRALLGKMFDKLTPGSDDGIDSQIERALGHVRAFAAVDHCGILRLSKDGRLLRATIQSPTRQAGWIPDHASDADFPWYVETVRAGHLLRMDRLADLPPEAHRERVSAEMAGVKSHLCVPVSFGADLLGGVALTCFGNERQWAPELTQQLEVIARLIGSLMALNATEMKLRRSVKGLTEARDQLQDQSERLEAHRERLREEIKIISPRDEIVDHSDAMREVMEKVLQVAPTDSTVLILGETGTGKELISRAVHERSGRRGKPMVKVNCAALPSALVESELFGSEKGAYTGAISRRIGRFELAHQSTILLDEIGDLPLELQGKLLRVLQDGEMERLGSGKSIHVSARVIAATNRDLEKAVRDGTFRQDLYYRLNVFTVHLPPLRAHPQNIPPLVWTFTRQFGEAMAKRISHVPPETMRALQRHPWPGNVRQLRNVIEHGMIISKPPVLTVEIPPVETSYEGDEGDRELEGMAEFERRHILEVLERTHWRVSGDGGAAKILDMKPTTLESRMRKLGIHRR